MRVVRRSYRRTVSLRHSVLIPSARCMRARGIAIVVGPRLVVSVRSRVPWRYPCRLSPNRHKVEWFACGEKSKYDAAAFASHPRGSAREAFLAIAEDNASAIVKTESAATKPVDGCFTWDLLGWLELRCPVCRSKHANWPGSFERHRPQRNLRRASLANARSTTSERCHAGARGFRRRRRDTSS